MLILKCKRFEGTANVRLSAIVYLIIVMALGGWLFFSVFSGVGIVCLPIDWISEFLHRPKRITREMYIEKKRMIGEQAAILKEAGEQLQADLKTMPKSGGFTRQSRNIAKREKNFRTDVLILEYHYRKLEDAYKLDGAKVLLQYCKFIGGIIGFVTFAFQS